jgi:pyruvate,orthophosphate dikinase
VRTETSPEDIHGMVAAGGILTARGGMTSHAAVVARGMGKPCVCGAGAVKIDAKAGTMTVGGKTWKAGDVITLDGGSGEVFDGTVPTLKPELTGDFGTLMGWADAARRMNVRANAETPNDARTAREFGAEGIGLCRTEHMFFEGDRILAMREMILAHDSEGRRAALEKLLPMQRQDFVELFTIMRGLPVTIRLLDPPLNEFLPKEEREIEEVAKSMKVDPAALRERLIALTESNPMLGHRGCRLLITYPEIVEMQTRAILEAAAEAAKATGEPVAPEIMVPLVGMRSELDHVKATIDATAKKLQATNGKIDYLVGTMIELPRAALRAQEIAEGADFFSFGTNDLTQTTFGISRDDAAGFIGPYMELGLIEKDPFMTLDADGVGVLVRVAANEGRKARPELKLGICGEHGGDPASIRFCDAVGLDYVSCSPFRVPIARLAAAQAALASAQVSTA